MRTNERTNERSCYLATQIHRSSPFITHVNANRVQNPLNGSYIVKCARPAPGSCATVGVAVLWEHFNAFHNGEAYADGTLSGAKGFQSHDSGAYRGCAEVMGKMPKLNACGKELVKVEHCEPPLPKQTNSTTNNGTPSWERVDKADVPSRAVWQREWVWRSDHAHDDHGAVALSGARLGTRLGTRLASRAADEGYRRCFGLRGKDAAVAEAEAKRGGGVGRLRQQNS